jgi:hypothetical protein
MKDFTLPIYNRGLKLKLIGELHSQEKMLRRPQFKKKEALEGRKVQESPKNNQNLIKN